ncbi:hypothetical protein [Caulobacter phage Cr30]|uniref:hypothetical protein n=1 Tax=Caulobacter phage Cr30 TaxID=1357714 RepID=UPI0004A9B68C|nr:hypothetical protein OZ74_gp069 [Caulobacter phage Cr30]AGS80954.1 hypothetical protein [Caulobacter phage Cr30]
MNHKKFLCIGPGGMNCTCCFPAPGSKERKYQFRIAKRKERREAFKMEDDNG